MAPAGFQPAIPAGERPQTHFLDRAATGIAANINKFSKQSEKYLFNLNL